MCTCHAQELFLELLGGRDGKASPVLAEQLSEHGEEPNTVGITENDGHPQLLL
jgi:hypothetical protein